MSKIYEYNEEIKVTDLNFFREDEIKSIKDKYSNPDITGKVIYKDKKSKFPQIKLNALKEKFNVKITKDINKADYVIIDNNAIKKYFKESHSAYIKADDLSKELKKQIPQLIGNAYIHRSHLAIKALGITISTLYVYTRSGYVISDADLNYVKGIFDSGKAINTDYLLNLSTSDSVILGESEFNSILEMINSGNKENLAIALEILANCNVDKSFAIISYFISFHIKTLQGAPNYNSANVKSLRNQFNDVPKYNMDYYNPTSYPFDKLIEYLHSKGKLTEFICRKIIEVMFNKIINKVFNLQWGNGAFIINVDSIKVRDKYLGINITDGNIEYKSMYDLGF